MLSKARSSGGRNGKIERGNVTMQCYTCFGRRYVTCPNCHGEGCYFKAVIGLGNVFEPCFQCGGSRHVKCQTCQATGVLPDTPDPNKPHEPPPPPLPPDPELLKLTDRWKGGRLRYELQRDNGGYSVTCFNFLGWKVGTGQATISGSTLGLIVKSLGVTTTADLQLKGGRLEGVMRTLGGLPWPLTLRHANGNS